LNYLPRKILLLISAWMIGEEFVGSSLFYQPLVASAENATFNAAINYSSTAQPIASYYPSAPPKKKKKSYYRKPAPAAQRSTATPLNQGIYGRTLDSLEFYEEEEYTLPGMLPEYDVYAYCDTLHVDAYRFSLKNLTEEVPLILVESDCQFAMPMYGRTNSTYGWRHGRPHTGIDLQLSIGDSVFSAFDGVVRMWNINQCGSVCRFGRFYWPFHRPTFAL